MMIVDRMVAYRGHSTTRRAHNRDAQGRQSAVVGTTPSSAPTSSPSFPICWSPCSERCKYSNVISFNKAARWREASLARPDLPWVLLMILVPSPVAPRLVGPFSGPVIESEPAKRPNCQEAAARRIAKGVASFPGVLNPLA
jgi:hypothetical protein